MRTFCVPDIHGRNDLLTKLLAQLKTVHLLDLTIDRLIFMGDMVDRGPDSKGVIDQIRALQKSHGTNHVIALFGNHEHLMLNALRKGGRDDFDLWLANGGGNTLRSFTGTDGLHCSGIDREYLEWIEGLPVSFQDEGFFYSHAPIPKEKDRKKALQGKPLTMEELTWTFFYDERGKSRHHKDAAGNPLVGVCGHIHALSRAVYAPRLYLHYLFLDAGCGCSSKAPLIACNVATREVVWAWPDGQSPIIPPKRRFHPMPPLVNSP